MNKAIPKKLAFFCDLLYVDVDIMLKNTNAEYHLQ